jgi:hypothetical protein
MPAGLPLCHSVYFALQDNSPAAVQQFVAACREYLSGHPGLLYFAVGSRAPDLAWEVSDVSFDVAVHLIFQDRAAHDQYQDSERHGQFIARTESNWKGIRCCDVYLEEQRP